MRQRWVLIAISLSALVIVLSLCAPAAAALSRATVPRPAPSAAPAIPASGPLPGTAGPARSANPGSFAGETGGPDLVRVGQAGGSTFGVAVYGRYAYAGVGPRLAALDVADPRHPRLAGQTPPVSGVLRDVKVSPPYAYAPDKDAVLHLFDITDPAAPREAGVVAGITEHAQILGAYAYLARSTCDWYWRHCSSVLRMVDISDPAAPRQAGEYSLGGRITSLQAFDHYVFVTAFGYHYGKLTVLDVSTPTSPQAVAVRDSSGWSYDGEVAIASHYAYFADGWNLTVFDLSNLPELVQMGQVPLSASRVAIVEHMAYVGASGDDKEIVLVDVSQPGEPRKVGSYVTTDAVSDLAGVGHYTYLALGAGGLRVVDVSRPKAVHEVDAFRPGGAAYRVRLEGSHAIVAGGDGVWIADIADPRAPRWVSRVPVAADDVDVAGGYAYAAGGSTGLRVLDISDVSSPREAGALGIPGAATGIQVAGHFAYVSAIQAKDATCDCWVGGGLYVVDVSAPDHPVQVGSYEQGAYDYVRVAGGLAYLGTTYDLVVLDVSDPTAPRPLGSCPVSGYVSGIDLAGAYAYIATWNYTVQRRIGALEIVDISDPARPRPISAASSLSATRAVRVAGRTAYTAAEDGSLQVYDVADPARPVLTGTYHVLGEALDIRLHGRYLYAAAGSGGLAVLLPAYPPVSARISAAGGSLVAAGEAITYTFDAGSFAEAVTITHTSRFRFEIPPTGGLVSLDRFFEVRAVDSATNQPVQPVRPYSIVLHYTPAQKGPAVDNTLALYWWDGAAWAREPSSQVQVEGGIVTAVPNRLGVWAVLGETRSTFLPVAVRGRR